VTLVPGPLAADRVTTARLVGRRPEPGDGDAYVRFYCDPRTPEELWPSGLRTAHHARATLEKFIEHWQRWGFGAWTVLLPGGEVIGYAGVQHTTIAADPGSTQIAALP
jgi:[ribosomal protein S5]-alanine N-acetyltransferase